MDLNQTTIIVHSLEESAAFYEALGLKRIVWSPPTYARYECPAGSSTLSLHLNENGGRAPVSDSARLYFEVDDVKRHVTALSAKGIQFDTPEEKSWRWFEAWTNDPDGRRICVYHAGPDRRFPPWRVDGVKAGETVNG
ncbi:MAG: VOC family protein [Pseudomonadota bacterium]